MKTLGKNQKGNPSTHKRWAKKETDRPPERGRKKLKTKRCAVWGNTQNLE